MPKSTYIHTTTVDNIPARKEQKTGVSYIVEREKRVKLWLELANRVHPGGRTNTQIHM